MQAIVESLSALNGVRHVGVYKNGGVLSTNFTADVQEAMLGSSELVAQVFLALEAVEKTHNEIFIGINSGYLAGFRLFGGHVVLLLTDKKINMPMLSMGIKSASEMLKQQSEEAHQDQTRQEQQLVNQNVDVMAVDPTNEALIPVVDQYAYILTEFLGPAATVVVDDAVERWKGEYAQKPSNLTYLIAALENELETDKEKRLFKTRVDRVAVSDM